MARSGMAGAAWRCVAVLGSALLGAATAPAQGQSLHRTNRVVEHSGHACPTGDGGCTAYEAETRSVAAGGSVEVAYECPAERPYLRNWDATRNEHVFLSVSPSRIGRGPLVLIAHNQADAPGYFKVLYGCAGEPAGVTSVMQSLGSRPTNVGAVRRNQP